MSAHTICRQCRGACEIPVPVEQDPDSGEIHAEYMTCPACDGLGRTPPSISIPAQRKDAA